MGAGGKNQVSPNELARNRQNGGIMNGDGASGSPATLPVTRCCCARSALSSRTLPWAASRGEAEKVRRYGDFRYAAKSWNVERRVIARVEAGPQGADSRFIVTNLAGLPKSLYEKVYCARGQAENLIKAHKLHLTSDRTSCTKATANQFRLLIHTAVCGRPRGCKQNLSSAMGM